MERLLCSQEMDQINRLYEEAFTLKENIIYFPVRHHSPACSYHLKKTIEKYKPQIILIEGPSNANHLIPSLTHEDSQTPLSIYYTYSDDKGLLGEKKDKYMCYYPFLDYSPEYVAMKIGWNLNIPTVFIDFPYEEILINSKEGEGIREKFKKKSYHDDYLIMRSKFIKELCKKQNCRDFNELWEKLYEIRGLHISTEEFVKNMLAYCYLSRVDYREEILEREGCIAREKYMNMQIQKYANEYEKILVITGGFHTFGLVELQKRKVEIKIQDIKKENVGAYAMAYSFEECNRLNGYASGMIYPAFYQRIWENICKNKEEPYEDGVITFISQCGRELRKKEEGISTADSIEAFNMAKGLAVLRDKISCGVYELLDGVTSVMVKGEMSVSNNFPLASLNKLMTGERIGKLSEQAEFPPIVLDFRKKCKKLRLNIHTSVKQEKILDIHKTKSHREQSKFFHMMNFLETNFCVKTKGPDYLVNKDTNLIREKWNYRWKSQVESKLIEHSVYGGSLKEAVSEILLKKVKDLGEHGKEATLMMIHAAIMGIEEVFEYMLLELETILQRDGSFYSLTEACRNLNFLYKQKYLMDLSSTEKIEILLKKAYEKSSSFISTLYNIQKDDENNTIQMLKELYQLSMDHRLHLNNEIYIDQLKTLIGKKDVNPALEGAGVGILIGMNQLREDEGTKRAKGYLYGSGEKFFESAAFLKGLFSTARDLILGSGSLINGIDHMLKKIEHEDFLKILPEMRLAFSFFIPREIDEIGEKVSVLYGTNNKEILNKMPLNEKEILLAKELDAFAKEQLANWGIIERGQAFE
ncbi:DUF5682 family protein [Crassaminicella profunda]|uniref:DUF5682 family protein n=1 Tax=Crassaminicella profunda TaxID=1286698 RepID=UPI001CA6C061|nr:DUF5682 family protein [Crassaminicella profunda]QZY56178.1 DUF5682 family protein [Crassaminicella profunda]